MSEIPPTDSADDPLDLPYDELPPFYTDKVLDAWLREPPEKLNRNQAVVLLSSGRKGVDVWNARRAEPLEYPIPSLSKTESKDGDVWVALLEGAYLTRANLSFVHLNGAELRGALLHFASLMRAELNRADLSYVSLINTFLDEASLKGANLYMAHLSEAHLKQADLERADLQRASLKGADIRGANFQNANVSGITFDNKMRCIGASVNLCRGSAKFQRTVNDNAYIEEAWLRARPTSRISWVWPEKKWFAFYKHWIRAPYRLLLVGAWWLFTDYGRSFWRLCATFMVIAIFGAWLFELKREWLEWSDCFLAYTDELTPETVTIPVPVIPSGDVILVETPPLRQFPMDTWAGRRAGLYFSVVTLTTLGFGDIKAASTGGAIAVGVLVILGYVMLGLLLSVLANKVARRA